MSDGDAPRYSELLKANIGNGELVITDCSDHRGTALHVIWPFTGGTLRALVDIDGVLLELTYQRREGVRPLGDREPPPTPDTLYRRSPSA